MSFQKTQSPLKELGKVSEQTKICGYPIETRDNMQFGCKGPWLF